MILIIEMAWWKLYFKKIPLPFGSEKSISATQEWESHPQVFVDEKGNTQTKGSAELGNGFVIGHEDGEKLADVSREKSLASHQQEPIPQRGVKNTFQKHQNPQNTELFCWLLAPILLYFLCSSKIPLKSVDWTI